MGSDAEGGVRFHKNSSPVISILISFKDWSYRLRPCYSQKKYLSNVPEESLKFWKISLLDTEVKVECNGVVVAHLNDNDLSSCKNLPFDKVTKVEFFGANYSPNNKLSPDQIVVLCYMITNGKCKFKCVYTRAKVPVPFNFCSSVTLSKYIPFNVRRVSSFIIKGMIIHSS